MYIEIIGLQERMENMKQLNERTIKVRIIEDMVRVFNATFNNISRIMQL
jgi:hypothetical protein